MKVLQVKETGERQLVLCGRCEIADRPLARLRGLMGRQRLARGDGLLLSPAPSIHTFFMRFPIDAVFLDAGLRVVGVAEDLPPWRTAGRRGARAVLELPAGEVRRLGVIPGMTVALVAGPAESSRDEDGVDGA